MSRLSVYVTDTETTSLAVDCDIIEVSFIRVDSGEQKTWYMKATEEDKIEQKALDINGHKLEDITWKTEEGKTKYRLPEEVLPEIENWIADDCSTGMNRVLVGHNVSFDSTRLRNFWKKHNASETYPFGTNEIDTKGFAIFLDWIEDKCEGSYSLSNVVKRFGLLKRKAHSASEDTAMTSDLLKFYKDKWLGQAKEKK